MHDKAKQMVRKEVQSKKNLARKLNKVERETVRFAYVEIERASGYQLTAFVDTLETRIRNFKLRKDADTFSQLVSATYESRTVLNEIDKKRNTAIGTDIASTNSAFSSKVTYAGKPRTNKDVAPKTGKQARISRQRATIRKNAARDIAASTITVPVDDGKRIETVIESKSAATIHAPNVDSPASVREYQISRQRARSCKREVKGMERANK